MVGVLGVGVLIEVGIRKRETTIFAWVSEIEVAYGAGAILAASSRKTARLIGTNLEKA